MYQNEWSGITLSDPISDSLHGGNFVATANSVRSEDSFTDVTSALGLSSLRFPGGDLTERFLAPNGPSWDEWISSSNQTITLPNGRELTTVRSFIEMAINQNIKVSIVLPTEGLLIRNIDGSLNIDEVALEKITQFASDLLSGAYGSVQITQFEIGNEYYVDGRLTASEYGYIANAMSQALGRALSEAAQGDPSGTFNEADILVQAGPPWQQGDNQTIIDALELAARGYVDGAIIHWYPRNLERIEALQNHFDVIDLWHSSDGFENIDLHVTEWNIFNSPIADTGLNQASALIEAYETLAIENVVSADIWGVSFPRLATRLAMPNSNNNKGDPNEFDDATLTPAGEIVRSLFTTTSGLLVLNLDASQAIQNAEILGIDNINHSISAFGNQNRAVVYISQRTGGEINLRVETDGFFAGSHYIVVQTFEALDNPTTAINEANSYNTDRAQITIRAYAADEFDDINLQLGDGEIARIEFVYGNNGVLIEGQIGTADPRISFHDSLAGSAYNDTIFGHNGNDTITGGDGQDFLYGGLDDDRIVGNFGRDSMFGDFGNDTLFGGGGSDLIAGGGGSDYLDGGRENDSISGEDGDDSLIGGDGTDSLYGGSGFDTLNGDSGDDWLDGGLHADSLNGGNGQDSLFGGQGFDLITGGSGNDSLFGGTDQDWMFGGIDNDTVNGGDGDDFLFGGLGFDTINGDGGNDRITGEGNADQLNGGDGNDTLLGEQGFDVVSGNAGNDSVYGGTDQDWMFGGIDNDMVDGGAGTDFLFGGVGFDTIFGGSENDQLNGEGNADQLFGGTGNDTLFGGAGVDRLEGGDNNDQLFGGTENDTLIGGAGNDTLSGGDGADQFVFAAGSGVDRIDGFQTGVAGEVILLTGLSAFDTYAEVQAAITVTGGNTVINLGGGNIITLAGVTNTAADDFIFA